MGFFEDTLEKALVSAHPINELQGLVQSLKANGLGQTEILGLFEQARQRLRLEKREKDEDAVMDAMDLIVGWCGQHAKAF